MAGIAPDLFTYCRPKVLQVVEGYDFSTIGHLFPTMEVLKI